MPLPLSDIESAYARIDEAIARKESWELINELVGAADRLVIANGRGLVRCARMLDNARQALVGVIRVADRKTDEFDEAKAVVMDILSVVHTGASK